MSSLNDLIDIMIYPLQKLFILLGSVQIFGVSLLSLLAAALVISVIFNFFIGHHSIGTGWFMPETKPHEYKEAETTALTVRDPGGIVER